MVLDPFRGCGTTIDAAEKLGRDWIGIDITALAIALIMPRLQDTCGSATKFVSGSAGNTGPWPVPSGNAPDGMAAGDDTESPSASDATPFRPAGRRSQRTSRPPPPETALVRVIGEPVTPADAAQLVGENKFQLQWWALGLLKARPVGQKKGANHGFDGKILFRDGPHSAVPKQIIIQVKGGKTGQQFPKPQLRTVNQIMEGQGSERPPVVPTVQQIRT